MKMLRSFRGRLGAPSLALLTLAAVTGASLPMGTAHAEGGAGDVHGPLVASATAVRLAPGKQQTLVVDAGKSAFNVGTVQFAVRGLPAGVTATFEQVPGTLRANLRLTAAAKVAPSTARITIVATGLGAGLRAPVTHDFTLHLLDSITISLGAASTHTHDHVTLSPCTGNSVELALDPGGLTGGAATLRAELPPGLSASFDPPTVAFASSRTGAATTITFQGRVTGTQNVTVLATRGSVTSRMVIPVSGSTVTAARFVSPTRVSTARLMRPGSTVTITGEGFCPGATVRFGNDDAIAPATVDPTGSVASAVVPRNATSGAVSLQNTNGHFPLATPVRVDSWRNSVGWSFSNTDAFQTLVGGYDFGMLRELFGDGQTRDFGLWDDPLAYITLGIAEASLRHGQCFGMVLSSLRVANHQVTLAAPSWDGVHNDSAAGPVGSAGDGWHMMGPRLGDGMNVSPALSHYIHVSHIAQLSREFVGAWLGSWNPTGDRGVLRDGMRRALARGTAAFITINGPTDHVMQAYDIEDTADGAYRIYVANPNLPFTTDEDIDGAAHTRKLNQSTIVVSPQGRYTFQDGVGINIEQHGLHELRAIAFDVVPVQPTIISVLGIFHTTGAEATVTQITDDKGRTMLRADGQPNSDPKSRIPQATPFWPLGGGKSAPVYTFGENVPFTTAIASKGNGTYAIQFASPSGGVAVKLEGVHASPGQDDKVAFDGAGGVEFITGAPQKPLKLQLTARAPDRSMRTATVDLVAHAGAPSKIAFDGARQVLIYRHSGPATKVRLELAQHGRASFATAPIDVEPNEVITLRPAWNDLKAGSGTIHSKKADGKESMKPLM